MTREAIAAAWLVATTAVPLWAQSTTIEITTTIGQSTDNVRAIASQMRVFGEIKADWRYFLEAAVAKPFGEETDAFGAAYPYEGGVRPMELFVEKTVRSGARVTGIRLGRYRTPFGMYGRSDQGYVGFLRAPLIRQSEYWGLSNSFLEGGASVVAGRPELNVEASLGVPQDEDEYGRRRGLDGVARVQAYAGDLIVGASHIRTRPSPARRFARGPTIFTGVDFRWMRGGVQVRGEWVVGKPFDGARTYGGYIDAIVHRPGMGQVTAVVRVDKLDYLAGPFSLYTQRVTAGARLQLGSALMGQINVGYQPVHRYRQEGATVEFGLTYSVRR